MRRLLAASAVILGIWALMRQSSKLRLWEQNENTAWGWYRRRIQEGREAEANPSTRPPSAGEGMRSEVADVAGEPTRPPSGSPYVAAPEPRESGEGILGRDRPTRQEMP